MAKVPTYSIEFYETLLESVKDADKLPAGTILDHSHSVIYQTAVCAPNMLKEYVQNLRMFPERYATIRQKMDDNEKQTLKEILSLRGLAAQERKNRDVGIENLVADGKLPKGVPIFFHGDKIPEGMKGGTGK